MHFIIQPRALGDFNIKKPRLPNGAGLYLTIQNLVRYYTTNKQTNNKQTTRRTRCFAGRLPFDEVYPMWCGITARRINLHYIAERTSPPVRPDTEAFSWGCLEGAFYNGSCLLTGGEVRSAI